MLACQIPQRQSAFFVHDGVIKKKRFPRYWPFVRGIHRSPVNTPHKGQWRGALMFSLICAWTNDWANTRDAGGLRHHRSHYDVTVMNRENPADHKRIPGIFCSPGCLRFGTNFLVKLTYFLSVLSSLMAPVFYFDHGIAIRAANVFPSNCRLWVVDHYY